MVQVIVHRSSCLCNYDFLVILCDRHCLMHWKMVKVKRLWSEMPVPCTHGLFQHEVRVLRCASVALTSVHLPTLSTWQQPYERQSCYPTQNVMLHTNDLDSSESRRFQYRQSLFTDICAPWCQICFLGAPYPVSSSARSLQSSPERFRVAEYHNYYTNTQVLPISIIELYRICASAFSVWAISQPRRRFALHPMPTSSFLNNSPIHA